MAKRFTDTELWDKEWFMNLSCKQKCLVKYVRDKADLSGIWSPNWILANSYIGEVVSEKELLEIDGGRQFKKSGGKIICVGFIEFQYGKLSEKSPVHRKILNLLQQHKIPYQYPINRVQEEEEDKEEEKVMVKEEEKEKHFEILEIQEEAQLYPTFEDFWNEYDKKVGEKGKLKSKWDKLRQEEKEKIMGYIPDYKLSQPDKKYRQNPETFFNNKSWNNELIFDNGKQQITNDKKTKWANHFAKRTGTSN